MLNQVNPFYLKNEMIATIKTTVRTEGMVLLREFFLPSSFTVLDKSTRNGWSLRCVPDRYCSQTRPAHPVRSLIRSFSRLVTGKEPLSQLPLRFSHRSYTLLHDEDSSASGVVALFFLDDWPQGCGGEIVFVHHGTTILRVLPVKNSLLLVRCARGTRYFVKYVNHKAKKRSFRVL